MKSEFMKIQQSAIMQQPTDSEGGMIIGGNRVVRRIRGGGGKRIATPRGGAPPNQ